jgi:indolepyruvate ferredoxin oxidoreductase, beta subunit
MTKVTSMMLVGVGGQGTILVGSILSKGLVGAGYDVKMSEVHGMAQRGGSVSTQVRYGEKVYSPLISKGCADVLVSFELMEALRWLEMLKPNGKLIVNDQEIASAPIQVGRMQYPKGAASKLRSKADTAVIKAVDVAEKLGDPRAMNIVLFGALVEALDLTSIEWEPVIAATVKPKFVAVNLQAYRKGRELFQSEHPSLVH